MIRLKMKTFSIQLITLTIFLKRKIKRIYLIDDYIIIH